MHKDNTVNQFECINDDCLNEVNGGDFGLTFAICCTAVEVTVWVVNGLEDLKEGFKQGVADGQAAAAAASKK